MACPKCGAEGKSSDAFCEKCGQKMDGAEGKPGLLGSLAESQIKKKLRSVRITILAVSVLTFLGAFLSWSILRSQIDEVRGNPKLVLDEKVVFQMKLMVWAMVAVGLVYGWLFYWVKKNPFAATLTALILFITLQMANLAIDPSSIVQGWIVKLVILIALINGVKAALSLKDLSA